MPSYAPPYVGSILCLPKLAHRIAVSLAEANCCYITKHYVGWISVASSTMLAFAVDDAALIHPTYWFSAHRSRPLRLAAGSTQPILSTPYRVGFTQVDSLKAAVYGQAINFCAKICSILIQLNKQDLYSLSLWVIFQGLNWFLNVIDYSDWFFIVI